MILLTLLVTDFWWSISSKVIWVYVYILTHSLVTFWSVVLSKCYPDVCYNICNEVYVWLITTNALLFIMYNARMHIFKINNIVKNLIVLQPVCYNFSLINEWLWNRLTCTLLIGRSFIFSFYMHKPFLATKVYSQNHINTYVTIYNQLNYRFIRESITQWIETQTNIKHINDYPNQDIEAIHELSF